MLQSDEYLTLNPVSGDHTSSQRGLLVMEITLFVLEFAFAPAPLSVFIWCSPQESEASPESSIPITCLDSPLNGFLYDDFLLIQLIASLSNNLQQWFYFSDEHISDMNQVLPTKFHLVI